MQEAIRINKYLSEIGYCSRREADRLLEKGEIKINGRLASLGDRVNPTDQITVAGQPVTKSEAPKVYIMLNKPVGIVCTTDLREPNNIIEFVGHPERIFPIGRLDKPSQGLILLTSDGDIVNKILRARNHHEKEYIVRVNQPITPEFLKKMGNGVRILDTMTRPCFIEKIDTFQFRIILTQGLNRQIRRMCEALGYEVKRLRRIRIMNLRLDIPEGQWRDLKSEELIQLNELLKDSDKTAD